LAHGSACDTEIWQPLAKLVSCAAPGCRSSTVTSWPALFKNQADVVPMIPEPKTITFKALLHLILAARTACPGCEKWQKASCEQEMNKRFLPIQNDKRCGSAASLFCPEFSREKMKSVPDVRCAAQNGNSNEAGQKAIKYQ
jgi:hypothetical protein